MMNVHDEIRWIEASELLNLQFCPADASLVKMLTNREIPSK